MKQNQTNKPPYGSPIWYEKFLDLVQLQKPDKVDASFLNTNGIATGNELKVITGLRFLGLISAEGIPTDKLDSLRVVGDEFKKNLSAIVNEAYAELKSKLFVDKAKPENLVNYFVTKYGMGGRLAEKAAKVFVFLCTESGIPISQELQSWQTNSVGAGSKPGARTRDNIKQPKKAKPKPEETPASDVVELKAENVRILLPKTGTLEAAKDAKSLLEWYIKEKSK